MAEYPEFSPKAKEIFEKAGLTRHALFLPVNLEWMRTCAESCFIYKVLQAAGTARETYVYIRNHLSEALYRGRISYDEYKIALWELIKLEDKYIKTVSRILKENCGCEFIE